MPRMRRRGQAGLERAGTSRETFYQQFSSKQDCFIAAYELAGSNVLSRLEQKATSDGTRLDRFDRAIGAYLDALATEPAFGRLFMMRCTPRARRRSPAASRPSVASPPW
jgi:AcrR family transcriptional regulator